MDPAGLERALSPPADALLSCWGLLLSRCVYGCQGGSFGVREDRMFELASIYARERGIPRIFLSANCGARIGLAEEVCVW
jgi:hypothetical protein